MNSALRSEDVWPSDATDLPAGIKWSEVEGYKGSFERLLIFIEDGIIDLAEAKDLHLYRIENLVAVDLILKEKIHHKDEGKY